MPAPWRRLRSAVLFEHLPWLRLREDAVELPTGAVLDPYYVLEYSDWACVVPVTEAREVVMVEQWRHAVGRASLEFPAGALDPGEEPEPAARRELREEAGVVAGALKPLATLATEPARHTNWAHLFLARDARIVGDPTPDANEDLRTRTARLDELPDLLASGRICHGIHAAAALLALRALDAPAGA